MKKRPALVPKARRRAAAGFAVAAGAAQAPLAILRIQKEVAVLDADLHSVMRVMVERAREFTGADRGAMLMAAGDELVCQASAGSNPLPEGTRLPWASSLTLQAIRSGAARSSEDTVTDPHIDRSFTLDRGNRSIVIVPVTQGGQVICSLSVSSDRPHAFSRNDIVNLEVLVESYGAIIQRHRMSEQVLMSENQYRMLFAQNPQPMWVYDISSLRLLAVNRAMVDLYGYTEQELLGMLTPALWTNKDQDFADSLRQRPADTWVYHTIRRHRKKDGTPVDMELSASPTVFKGMAGRMVLAVDVTQRLRAERELARLSRAQQLLSACNEALMRATSEDALLTEICRITLDIGGYLGAWVGFARDDPRQSIEPVVFAGAVPGYVFELPFSWSDESPFGQAPTGRTIRFGQVVIVENVEHDISLAPWIDLVRAGGVRSMISLPLRRGERTFGLLSLYANEVVEVGSSEVKLLQELANDLAFGLGNLQVQAMVRNQASLLDKAQDAIILRSMDDQIQFWNQSAERLYGWTAQEAMGRSVAGLLYPQGSIFADAMCAVLASGAWVGEVDQRRKDGSTLCVEARWTLVRDDLGRPQSVLAINTDITERKAAEHKIQHLAFYDALTHLPNRLLLTDRLQQALLQLARSGNSGALLFIDLDNFKTLNDTRGHHKGDVLLQQVAARLLACVREADTVARLGGDEFVVLLADLGGNPQEAAQMASMVGHKILAALAAPYRLDGDEHRATSSIGVAPFCARHAGVDELLKQADLAMYEAKSAGRNALRFFDPSMQAVVNARAALESEMRQALAQGRFELHYQPQADGQGRVFGVEALLRWHHPSRGAVSPVEFIPLAEETGIIIPLGHWVLLTACEQLQLWQQSASTAQLTVAVNVSARQFRSAEFVQQVAQVLAASGANPARLKLELTESALVDDVDAIIGKMAALRALGVSFSLDDFGTGYSSLSYLKRLPLDQLKIDRSFVRDIMTDTNDAAIVRTIIALGQSLGLNVIAEGVETATQRDYLAAHGCLTYQGYYFSRPLPVAQLEVYLANRA